jgi:hypothetical protein
MPDEAVRRQQAREAIAAGRVPTSRGDRIWGGDGTGVPCVICGELIGTGQAELEVEFGPGSRRTKYPMHERCFAAWELERTK